MARIWRNGPGQLLVLYLILGVLALALVAVAHPGLTERAKPLWLPVAAFLAWRVSRGGRASRIILIILSLLGFAGAAFSGTQSWSLAVLGLLAVYATQIALLVSPAVYQRTRRDWSAGQPAAASIRVRPPLWMLLSALLAGLVVTLLYLGSMDFAAMPGCGPAAVRVAQLPVRCFGLARGYPLRFLTAYQGSTAIDRAALIEDWAQWTLVSFSVFYLWWLTSRRPGPQLSQPSQAEDPAAV